MCFSKQGAPFPCVCFRGSHKKTNHQGFPDFEKHPYVVGPVTIQLQPSDFNKRNLYGAPRSTWRLAQRLPFPHPYLRLFADSSLKDGMVSGKKHSLGFILRRSRPAFGFAIPGCPGPQGAMPAPSCQPLLGQSTTERSALRTLTSQFGPCQGFFLNSRT